MMAKEWNLFEQSALKNESLPDDLSVMQKNSPNETLFCSPSPPNHPSNKTLLSAQKLQGVLEKIKHNQEQQEQEKTAVQKVKQVIEALLFASNEPIPLDKLREVTDAIYPFKPKKLLSILEELAQEYLTQKRSYRLEEIAQGYLLRTCQEFSPYIDQLYRNRRHEKLSHAATEVLAIIAYRQPITRPQIEAIRGVDCSGTIQSLMERQLIEPVGKLEAPGRPTLYGITKDFLSHFGLRNIQELIQKE